MAVRPRSSVFPMNWDRSSMDALTDSQMQQVISTLLNGVLMNSHLSVDPSLKELLMVSMSAYLCGEGIKTLHCQFPV